MLDYFIINAVQWRCRMSRASTAGTKTSTLSGVRRISGHSSIRQICDAERNCYVLLKLASKWQNLGRGGGLNLRPRCLPPCGPQMSPVHRRPFSISSPWTDRARKVAGQLCKDTREIQEVRLQIPSSCEGMCKLGVISSPCEICQLLIFI